MTTILVVDDQRANTALLQGILSRRGYKVETASSADQALAIIDRAVPDLMLLDVFMPSVSGLDLLGILRKREKTASLPIILVSALTDTDHIVIGLNQGANDYVTKPLIVPILLARIEALLRSSELVKHLEVQKELLSQLAALDELTGLYNRRSMFQALETERARSMRYMRPLSVVMVDLDHFKRVNDEYGHGVGDEVLRKFAGKLVASLRTMDVACRYGGEEFCAILPETDVPGAVVAGSRIRATAESEPLRVGDFELKVTVSVGVSGWAPVRGDMPDLLAQADAALLEAKRTGRNRLSTFESKVT